MSKLKRLRVDVGGRFEVDIIRARGSWSAYRRGADGKRSWIGDLQVDDAASPEEVLAAFEAACAERPLRVIDILMA